MALAMHEKVKKHSARLPTVPHIVIRASNFMTNVKIGINKGQAKQGFSGK